MRTKEQTEQEFIADLKSLLKKYNAEIEATDHWKGYPECGEDVRMTVTVPGAWDEDGEVLQEYTEIDLGKLVDGK